MSNMLETRVAYEMLTELETEIVDFYWMKDGITTLTDDDLIRWASKIYAIKEIIRNSVELI